MQSLEIILLLVSFGFIAFNRFFNDKLRRPVIIGVLIFVLILHLVIDEYRWQMIPAYLCWMIALITAVWQAGQTPSLAIRIFKHSGLILLLALAIALPTAFPVFDLPLPTGQYTVATTDILLELDREEVITADKSDNRRLMIKVWYPSQDAGVEQDPYVDKAGRSGFAQKYGLPSPALNYLDQVETHVYRNIPVAEEVFPVLIFSHGYNSKANGYYAILSEIVNQGYIIFAINHTYESTGTTFPDGSTAFFNYDYASQIESGTWETVSPAIDAFKNGLPFEERHPVVRKALTSYFVRDIVERWAHDITDVINELNGWNNSGFLKGRMDVSRLGVFGHSRGGGAAGHATLIDDRIKAGANIDGVQWGAIVDTAFQKPFLFLSADWPADHEDLNSHAYINKSTSWFYEGMIHESAHSNFMDIPFMIPVQALSQAGSIEPELAIEITNRTVISFFNKHLKDSIVDMSALSGEFDMLELAVYQGDSLR